MEVHFHHSSEFWKATKVLTFTLFRLEPIGHGHFMSTRSKYLVGLIVIGTKPLTFYVGFGFFRVDQTAYPIVLERSPN